MINNGATLGLNFSMPKVTFQNIIDPPPTPKTLSCRGRSVFNTILFFSETTRDKWSKPWNQTLVDLKLMAVNTIKLYVTKQHTCILGANLGIRHL